LPSPRLPEIERSALTGPNPACQGSKPPVPRNGVRVGVGSVVGRGRHGLPVAAIGVLGSALLLLLAGSIAGFRLNLTGSLPPGLYRAAPGALVRGSLVLVCLSPQVAAFARARGYVPRGGACPGGVLPVGKPVLALPGDTVTVTATGLRVNGVPVPNSFVLATDHRGRALPRLAPGPYLVRPGTLWVVSTYARASFDSRYFGPVALAGVRSYLRPVWTAGPER
jgi:conjugative transfer signal peptidase TraF